MDEWGFRIQTPATPAALRRNVQHALSLGLPVLRPAGAREDRLAVLATGPSALTFRGWETRRPLLSVNGALRDLCLPAGVLPTWWAACDPQPLVADFVREAPDAVTYLVASKCHPDVFDALRGRDVRLFHLSDDDGTQGYGDLIGGEAAVLRGSSVALVALELARTLLGFSRQETFGWDGCWIGGLHHAGESDHKSQVVSFDIGGIEYPTSRGWIYEAMGAIGLMILHPRDLIVHGDGMFGAALRARGLLPHQLEPA